MKIKKHNLLIVVIVLALTPLLMADMGPKPSMDFELEYDISPIPNIVSSILMECDEPDCSDGEPLEDMGPQGLYCYTNDECTSVAYGYNGEYFQMVLEYDDGVTRTSNVFTHHKFAARYKVTVLQDALEVEKNGGSGNPYDMIGYGAIGLVVCFWVVVFGVIGFVLYMIINTRRKKKAAQANNSMGESA